MQFLEGIPLLDAGKHISGLSRVKREAAKRRILHRVSEAYGRMILSEGLFQLWFYLLHTSSWVRVCSITV